MLRNVAAGYTHVNDPDLLESLIAPYFAEIRTVWDARSFQLAQYIVHGFYPSAIVSRELVAATHAWLDANPEVPALRRMVIEELAGVERALAAQERDAQA